MDTMVHMLTEHREICQNFAFLLLAALALGVIVGGGGRWIVSGIKAWRQQTKVEMVVNPGPVNGADHPAYCLDPSNCPAHGEEKGRSLRNERDIASLSKEFETFKGLIFKKLTFIKQQNDVMLRAMVKRNQIEEKDIPKEVV